MQYSSEEAHAFERLKNINADLLEALKAILPWVKVTQESARDQVDATYEKALDAIANAEKE